MIEPKNMVLHCPECGFQHIDKADPNNCEDCGHSDSPHFNAGERNICAGDGKAVKITRNGEKSCNCEGFNPWLNPPHKSHRSHKCNHVWRPFEFPTNGVAGIPWRCFHCDETFIDPEAARTHFGATPESTPVCDVDPADLRAYETRLSKWAADLEHEQSRLDSHDAIWQSKLATAAREANETGYAKGVEEGRMYFEKQLAQLRAILSKATVFQIAERVTIEARNQSADARLWTVCKDGHCLNDFDEFEYEPRPSSRTDAFIERTRFDSLESAFKAFEVYQDRLAKKEKIPNE